MGHLKLGATAGVAPFFCLPGSLSLCHIPNRKQTRQTLPIQKQWGRVIRLLGWVPDSWIARHHAGISRYTRYTHADRLKGGTPRSPVGRKRRATLVPEQGVSRPQRAPGAMGGAAKRSEPEEEP